MNVNSRSRARRVARLVSPAGTRGEHNCVIAERSNWDRCSAAPRVWRRGRSLEQLNGGMWESSRASVSYQLTSDGEVCLQPQRCGWCGVRWREQLVVT